MAIIRPCADLRNHYNEISKICRDTKGPVYITKNGTNDSVLVNNEVFEEMFDAYKMEQVSQKLDEEFDKKYSSYEEFAKDVDRHIEIGLKQIENGQCRPAEEFWKEMEEKYGIHG
ncbi:MAG: type II toxin-antitoxin system prevent-host-death family antitoxin [Firmicutes bacterium]|nr:type II toxin-antitoxin system prevent-host-death family antitoxin [Bacillota bacterium]